MGTLRLFQATIFLSASLLFLIQPMFAKLTLPTLGGTPAVWNTCMLFFQFMLLVGYGYAHAWAKWVPQRMGAVIHLGILAIVLMLPSIAIPDDWNPPTDRTPVYWLLSVLLITVGAPFFAVATTSPLIQYWFAKTDHPQSNDPYFLYAASNVGSFASLLLYPLLLERWLPMDQQTSLWRIGYGVFVLMMAACAVIFLRSRGNAPHSISDIDAQPAITALSKTAARLSIRQRLHWVLLAFIPSSWMLGVTQFLTTDLAPIPLLWIVPLALYLLTFVLAFATKPLLQEDFWKRLLPFLILALATSVMFQGVWQLIPLHLAAFFVGSMVCHHGLAADRPHVDRLTEFYLWISLGGVLGGIFNAIVAPVLFPMVLEYPLIMILACWVHREGFFPGEAFFQKKSNLVMMGLYLVLVFLFAKTMVFRGTETVMLAVLVGIPLAIVSRLFSWPRVFAAAVGLVLLVNAFEPPFAGKTLFAGRSYYGVHRVLTAARWHQYRLLHGATVHGIQIRNPRRPELAREPLAYYSRVGPLGQVFATETAKHASQIGVVGLGAGAAICYWQPGKRFTFFEIDPMVAQIAEDPRLFTYLSDAQPDSYDIVLGDGRTLLAQQPQHRFDLILFDAFSSDSIPMHLLTREALQIYRDKLKPDGLMVFHISNQHLDLRPILSSLIKDAGLHGLSTVFQPNAQQENRGIATSSYVVASPQPRSLTSLQAQGNWTALPETQKAPWTDDFSNLIDALR